MRKNVPNEPNIDEILTLLCSLNSGLFHALTEQGAPIIVVALSPVLSREDDEDDYDEDDCDDEDDYDDEDEPEDDEGCCPEYEPADDGTGRCVYACPECGICLRDYIGEEFE